MSILQSSKLAYIALCICLMITGCSLSNWFKHGESSLVGLHRSITLYAANGQAIKQWDVRSKVEDNGGTCYFITRDNKAVIISGTFIIEEQ